MGQKTVQIYRTHDRQIIFNVTAIYKLFTKHMVQCVYCYCKKIV